MKSFFRLLERTAGAIGLLITATIAVLDFLSPLGSYVYILSILLFFITILVVLCSKNQLLLLKVKKTTSFLPGFIKSELNDLWQPEEAPFWKKGLIHVLVFLTALSIGAALYAQNNSKGFLATNIETIASLQTSLGLIVDKLEDISIKQDKVIAGVQEVSNKLDLVKKETSDNPRKELANMGVRWDENAFLDAIKQGDLYTVELFLMGGMNPENQSINYSAHSILSLIIYWNVPRLIDQIKLFEKYGLDINKKFLTTSHSVSIFGKKENYSVLTIAIESNNIDLINWLLLERRFDIKKQYDNAGNLYFFATNSLLVKSGTFELLTQIVSDKLMQNEAANSLAEQLNELEGCLKKPTSVKVCIGSNQHSEIIEKLKIAERE